MFRSRLLRLMSLVPMLAVVLALAFAAPAQARMGGSFGSRGMRTFSAPATTSLAPRSVAPIERSMTPNSGYSTPGYGGYGNYRTPFGRGGFWPGVGGGLLGAALGGLLFHGLFGSMLGYGFGGIGGGLSTIFQLLILAGIVWLAFRWFRGRQTMGPGGYGGGYGGYGQRFPYDGGPGYGDAGSYGGQGGGASGPWGAGPRDEIGVSNRDLETFERILGDVQAAYSREDHQALRRYSTPEMVSYFSEELAENATHGLRNDVSDFKFLNGELAEAWREGNHDYATVVMQWSAIDVMRDRQTGEVKRGDPNVPAEGREYWTFVRENGGPWLLSAIQDAR